MGKTDTRKVDVHTDPTARPGQNGVCHWCGHDPSCGFASWTDDTGTYWYCHTDDHSCVEAARDARPASEVLLQFTTEERMARVEEICSRIDPGFDFDVERALKGANEPEMVERLEQLANHLPDAAWELEEYLRQMVTYIEGLQAQLQVARRDEIHLYVSERTPEQQQAIEDYLSAVVSAMLDNLSPP